MVKVCEKKGAVFLKKRVNYRYDALNRITSGVDNTGKFNLNLVEYDKNGNITALKRKGAIVTTPVLSNTSHFGLMDNLDYDYQGNQLIKVAEILGGNKTYGFKDSSVNDQDYWYDANGNMTKDDNKGITGITYNHLNLPTKVTFGTKGFIKYFYDASGAKQQKVVTEGSSVTTTDYAGNYVYENNTLQFFNHAEGYVEPEGTSFNYIYQYKDHLGNIRLSYTDADGNGRIKQDEIIEENNYYPFGLKHKGYNNVTSSLGNSVAQRYKFGGKEYDESFGGTLNTYDFGARNYDPSLGRWMNIDPLAEFMRSKSPYIYGFNNPIYFSDSEGAIPWPLPEVFLNWFRKNRPDSFFRGSRPGHNGVDLNYNGGGNTDLGAPIVATHSGRVVRINPTTNGAGGRIVVIESVNGNFETKYMHLSSISVEVGDEINENQTIGLMGGAAFGSESGRTAHLHYEIYRNGQAVNPWQNGAMIDPQLWQSTVPQTEEQYYNSGEYLDGLYPAPIIPLRFRVIALEDIVLGPSGGGNNETSQGARRTLNPVSPSSSPGTPIPSTPSPVTPIRPRPPTLSPGKLPGVLPNSFG